MNKKIGRPTNLVIINHNPKEIKVISEYDTLFDIHRVNVKLKTHHKSRRKTR